MRAELAREKGAADGRSKDYGPEPKLEWEAAALSLNPLWVLYQTGKPRTISAPKTRKNGNLNNQFSLSPHSGGMNSAIDLNTLPLGVQ